MLQTNFITIFLAFASLLLLLKILGYAITNLATKYFTVLPLLNDVGTPRENGKIRGTALIAGGSIAGIAAARVLSDHFEHVVVVEPDAVATDPNPRTSTRPRLMQWHAHHGFLAIILLICRNFFPSFDQAALDAGMHIGTADEINYCLYRRTILCNHDKAPSWLVSSRPVFERLLRRLLISHCSNVTIIQGSVVGLSPSSDGKHISEVAIRHATAELDAGVTSVRSENVPVGLFVDCSGASSVGTKLLPRAKATWHAPARRDVYAGKVRYSSAIIRLPLDLAQKVDFGGKKWEELGFVRHFIPDPRIDTRGYGISKVDANTLQVTAMQWGDLHYLPNSLSEYIVFCENIERNSKGEAPWTHIIDGLRGVSDLVDASGQDLKWFSHKVDHLHFHRYDLATEGSLPANFAVLGDAIMRLNPVFGQGCAKAMVDAVSLDGALREVSATSGVPANFATSLLKAQTRRTSFLFDLTRWMDYAYPSTEASASDNRSTGSLLRAYMRAAISVAHRSRYAGDKIIPVLQLVKSPTDLFHPWILSSALLDWSWKLLSRWQGSFSSRMRTLLKN